MESADTGINIQFSEKALKYIKARQLRNPLVLVNLASRSGGESSGDGCGGGCGEGDQSTYVPYVTTALVDGGTPSDAFTRVDTQSGIPVYMSKSVLGKARRSTNPLLITLKGLVMKKLILEGLDLTPSAGNDSKGGSNCH